MLDHAPSDTVRAADPWDVCSKLARTHYENFTVGSLFLPKSLRRHFWSVYAYCRTVDDLGDEAPGDRLALLDEWERELRLCWNGTPRHPVTSALQETIRTFDLSMEPFLKLIEANRQDQRVEGYRSFSDLLGYCELSANPVGHLVLGLLRLDTPHRRALSDKTCTALQLTNFWQDVGRDLEKGRIYLPLDEMTEFGYSIEELQDRRVNDAFRSMLASLVKRTRDLFSQGEALLPQIPGRFRIDIAVFTLGGQQVLDAIERQGFDVITRRPTLSSGRKLLLLSKAAYRHGLGRSQ